MINLVTNNQFNTSIPLADNAMLKHSPRLFNEWDFEKNDELELDIYKITKGYTKEVWWNCNKCKSNYSALIVNRLKGNCPYCIGRRVNHTNSLATILPNIASEWHPTLNGDLTPHDVTWGSGQKVWWLCELGHEYENSISGRKECGCPYCSGHRVMKGFNDINTTSIKLKNILLNYEDGFKYSKGSKVKLNWKCECGQIIKNKSPFIVNREGLSCSNCTNNYKSYPERFMYHLLKQLNIKFKWEKTFKWSQGKRYDFYLPSQNVIIEVHGAQHYNGGFEAVGGRTLQEEQENDILKEQLAKKNGIEHYIIIDARESNMNWMKNTIVKSLLPSLLDCTNINYENIDLNAREKLIFEMESLWKKNKSIKLISKVTGLHRDAVVRYLKTLDTFDVKEDIDYIKKHIDNKRIIEYDLSTSLIKEWESSECIADVNFSISTLPTIRNFKDKYYFKRSYFLSNTDAIKYRIQEITFENIQKRKILQLNYNFELVKTWDDNLSIIGEHFGLNTANLSAHLRGEQLSFANHLWCYDDELNNRIQYFKDKLNNKYSYLIYQFDLDGNLINQWRNNSEMTNYNGNTINFKHLKKKVLDKNHYYKGYIFLKSYKYNSIDNKHLFFKEIKNKYKKHK